MSTNNSLNDFEIDPNNPTETQVKLKRVEVALRRRADCALVLMFDGIPFIPEADERRRAMIELRQKLVS
jgi:hypothetical protein